MVWLDHLVMSCDSLALGEAHLDTALGLPLAPGGEHAAMSTHNRLLSLGPIEYFELIAINPAAPAPGRNRWFALDRFAGMPRLTNWVLACKDLEATLALCPPGMGTPMAFTRGDLRWRMAVPESGELPFDNVFPALIEWEGPLHPAPRLPEQDARLQALHLSHPDAAGLAQALGAVFQDPCLQISHGPAAITADILTPKGLRRL